MEAKKNLCAPISADLHAKVREEQLQLGQSLGEYVEQILTEHFSKKVQWCEVKRKREENYEENGV